MAKIASFDFSLECDDVIQDFGLGGIHLTFFFRQGFMEEWKHGCPCQVYTAENT